MKFSFFWGGGFQKNEYFFGMKILWIFLGGHHKISLYLHCRGHFYAFWVFFNVKVQNGGGGILGLLKFQIFLGVLEIPVFFCCFFCFCFFFWGGG